MNLDADRLAVLSGLKVSSTASQKTEVLAEANHNEPLNESEEIHRLRMIIREEVQAAFNELRAARDMNSIETASKTKKVSAAMGFSGPGFGGEKNATVQTTQEVPAGRPTHGLMRGFGF